MGLLASLSRVVPVVTLAVAVSSTAHAASTWTEVRSPHFRVLTDGSEKQGRNVAEEFEQMRHVFSSLFGRDDFESGPPLTVVAARNLDTFRDLEPALYKARKDQIAGEFHGGWEKQFATIRLDTWTDQNQVVVFHEYSHSILHANLHWMPTWLDEGLAEYYGYTRFESKKIYIGAPSLRFRELRAHPLLPLDTVLDVNNRSPLYNDESQVQLFYAQSWAMVHFMEFGPGMDHGAKLKRFLDRIQEGEPQHKAFAEAFGDPKAFSEALSFYISRFTFSAGVLPAATGIEPETYTAHQLSPAELNYELACFHIGNHDRATGKRLLEQAVSLDPKLAGPHEELGYLAFERGDDATAHTEWTEAVALDPSLPRANYALLMTGKPLAQQSPAELAATQTGLHHIAELAPKFAPAYVELALVEWRLGKLPAAYRDAYKAETLAPWRAGYRTLTANILLRGHQPAVANRYAHFVATHWFGPDHDEAVDLWQKIPAADRGTDGDLALDVPAGSTVVRGTITTLACAANPGDKLTLTLQPAGPQTSSPLVFTSAGRFMSGWSDTLWYGSDHFNLCHHVTGRPALVAYKPTAQGGGNELVDLEIRDDLPAEPAVTAASAPPTTAAAAASSTTPSSSATAAAPASGLTPKP